MLSAHVSLSAYFRFFFKVVMGETLMLVKIVYIRLVPGR